MAGQTARGIANFDGSEMSMACRTTVSNSAILLALAVLATGCAAASPPRAAPSFPGSPSWSAISSSLFGGQNIVIGLRPGATVPGVAGNEFSAVFQESDADTLTVRRGNVLPGTDQPVGRTILDRDDVFYVRTRVRVPDSTADGTIKGLLIGAAAMAAILGVLCTQENDCPLLATSAIFGAPAVAWAGFIGKSYDRKRTDTRLVTIYQAR